MTLAKARAEANRAFKAAKATVMAGEVSARSTSESLITVFWGLLRQLRGRDKTLFQKWYDRKHDALGKELWAIRPVLMGRR